MRFFLLIWVSVRLMASAQRAELLAPLPAPVPGRVKAFLPESGVLCFALLPYTATSISLSPCLPGIQRAPSRCSSENSPSLFAAFSPGQYKSSRFLYATSGTASNATQVSCLHSFPHTLDNSSIFTRSSVHRIANKHSLKKIK